MFFLIYTYIYIQSVYIYIYRQYIYICMYNIRFRLSLLEIEPLVLPPWIMDAAFPSRDRVLLLVPLFKTGQTKIVAL